ncbi:MAG: Cytochrome c1 heme lyase [Piccolia ochrophora]|nr:MAG: Cytochrome c1 heme lyase [Piccolia ochrophora]
MATDNDPPPSPSPPPPSACPVDHSARVTWLSRASNTPSTAPPAPSTSTTSCSSSTTAAPPSSHAHPLPTTSLSPAREISSIPRSTSSTAPLNADQQRASPSVPHAVPAPDPHTSRSGNWIYPSEQMFFAALRRKNHTAAQEADMRAIVPIHNAVNEKAWKEIKEWEKGRGSETCGGPRLDSFSGDASAMTPKARLNSLLGYTEPFDRHDWVVDRCGVKVEYVIDFYAGREREGGGGKPSFYLDVRPKLNSWEGWKMRARRAVGWT